MRQRQRVGKWQSVPKLRAAKKRAGHAAYHNSKRRVQRRRTHGEIPYVPYTLEEHLEL